MLALILLVAVFAFVTWLRERTHATEIEVLHERLKDLAARVAALEVPAAVRKPAAPVQTGTGLTAAAPAPSAAKGTGLLTAPPVVPTPPAEKATGRPMTAPPAPSAPIPTRPAAAAAAPVAAPHAHGRDSLEARIGSRWLLYIGVVAIVVGVAYFEKLAIDNHWINETARTIQSGLLGALLIYAGMRFVRAGYRLYGQMLAGGGVAIFYVSVYAAFNLYQLIGRPTAFGLMFAITTFAAWLADRQRSQGLALMAVGGGFVTPFLLPGDTDAEIALFTYDAILIAGTMYLAHRRVWPLLNTLSYGVTTLTVLGWSARFYSTEKYVTTELFITLFCVMFLYVLREMHRSSAPQAQLARLVLWSAPLFYYAASLAILSPHGIAFLIYLVGVALVGAAAGRQIGAPVRLVCWAAAFMPLAAWLDDHAGRTWLAAGLATVAGVYLINLASDLERALRDGHELEPSTILLLHLNGLAAYGCAYLLIDAVRSDAAAPAAAMFALWHVGIGWMVSRRRRDVALHFGALAGTLAAIAIALQYHGAAAIAGWAAEGAAVVWLGLRERREWFRAGGLLLFGFAIVRLVDLQMSQPLVTHVALLNAKAAVGLFVVALTYSIAWLHDRHPHLPTRTMEVGIDLTAATLLILSVAATEIVDYSRVHPGGIFQPSAGLAVAGLVVGAVIVWLGLRRQQEPIRAVGGLVVGAAGVLLLSLQFEPAPSNYAIVFNARAAAGALAVAILYGLAQIHRTDGSHISSAPSHIAVLMTAASLYTLSLLTSEIDAYWGARGAAQVWSTAREGLQAIVWAGIGSVIVWLGVNRRTMWIRVIGAATLAAGIGRLLNLEFTAAPAGYIVVANARFVASIVVIALLVGLARAYRSAAPLDAAIRPRTVLLFAANAVGLVLLTSEIAGFWRAHDLAAATSSAARDSHFARELMLSATWAIYAAALIGAGIRKAYAPIRYFGIGLFAVTIVKVFGLDMAELDKIYRVSSIIVLGVMLLATSYVYNRFRSQIVSRPESGPRPG